MVLVIGFQELYNEIMWKQRTRTASGEWLPNSRALFLLSVLVLLAAQPAFINMLVLDGEELQKYSWLEGPARNSTQRDPDPKVDELPVEIVYQGQRIQLMQQEKEIWISPAEWQVLDFRRADLNRDGVTELALLVRRPFKDIPINAYTAVQWKHPAFRFPDGDSCHIILIGIGDGEVDELWAGSGLVRPMTGIQVVDLDGDGMEELAGLEPGAAGGTDISIWRWQGFNFTLIDRTTFLFMQQVEVARMPEGGLLIVSGWEDVKHGEQ